MYIFVYTTTDSDRVNIIFLSWYLPYSVHWLCSKVFQIAPCTLSMAPCTLSMAAYDVYVLCILQVLCWINIYVYISTSLFIVIIFNKYICKTCNQKSDLMISTVFSDYKSSEIDLFGSECTVFYYWRSAFLCSAVIEILEEIANAVESLIHYFLVIAKLPKLVWS